MANQSLFDSLAGAFGHGVDRPALNSFVANSQAINGLRSAQTEEALNNAQMQQEEMQARGDLESSLSGALGDDGKPLLAPSGAHLVANELIGKFGDAKSVMQAYREAQQAHNTSILSNPDNLNTPAATAAASGLSGKTPEPIAVHPEYVMPAGVAPPAINQTPLGAAQTAAAGANAELHTNEAEHPNLFHPNAGGQVPPDAQAAIAQLVRENPNLAGNLRSLVSNGGWGVAYNLATGHPYQAAPAGGGASGAPAPGGPAPAAGPNGAPPSPAPQPVGTGLTPAPGVSLHEQALIRSDFANGLAARQTSSLNTMVNHSQLFDAIADQLQNGNFTPTNAIAQKWKQLFGSAVPSNLAIAGSFLGREAVRATVNAGAGTGQERELQVDDSGSPDMLHGAAQTLRTLAAGQLQSLDLRARRGGVDIAQLLSPDAQTTFGRAPMAGAAGPAPPLPNPANPADAGPHPGVIPDGTTAINRSTGVRMIRKGGVWQIVQ